MRIRPAVVIVENDKVMLMRYSYSGKDVYQFPGGNTEEVESLEETLARELEEELSLPISVGRLILSAQAINSEKKQATFHCLFEGTIRNSVKPIINAKETSALEVVWIDINKLSSLNLYPSVGIKLNEILNSKDSVSHYLGLIEQPWF